MKQYLLFFFNTIHPSGGWGDFVGDFDTMKEVAAKIDELNVKHNSTYTLFQVIDRDTKNDAGNPFV